MVSEIVILTWLQLLLGLGRVWLLHYQHRGPDIILFVLFIASNSWLSIGNSNLASASIPVKDLSGLLQEGAVLVGDLLQSPFKDLRRFLP